MGVYFLMLIVKLGDKLSLENKGNEVSSLNTKYMTQTALSESVGWSESNGRRWIKKLEAFIPFKIVEGNKCFDFESQKVLSIIKQLSEKGYTSTEIKNLFDKQGVLSINDVQLLKDKTTKEYVLNNQSILDTLPPQKELILAILHVIRDRNVYTSNMISDAVASYLKLSEDQLNMRYEEGKEYVYSVRMRSARFSLKKQEYIEEVSKLTYQITNEGLNLLKEDSHKIEKEIVELENVIDPLDIINKNVIEINNKLIKNLIDHLKKAHWRRLESIVIDLLTAMGYGDGEVTQKTNDGGLDGVIKEDRLGLDNIYVQAKKYDTTVVGRPEVMGFSGALDAKGARKGIFITTSSFTKGAEEYAERLESKKIILIDGRKLARLMIENNIGVSIQKKIIVKEVELSYFEGE